MQLRGPLTTRSSPPRAPTPRKAPKSPKSAAARRHPIDDALSPELFKALADPTRASLLACLAKCRRGCTVGEVAECCDIDLSVVSRHLAALAEARVLNGEKRGRTMLYTFNAQQLASQLRTLADAIDDCRALDDSSSCCIGTPCCPTKEPKNS